MTLIEVLAGLALMSTLLASILVAKGRWTHQYTLAQRRIEAVQAADALMSEWWNRPEQLAKPATGRLEESQMTWKRTLVPGNESTEKLGVKVVRLEIFGQTPKGSQETVLANVEVVIPDEDAQAQ